MSNSTTPIGHREQSELWCGIIAESEKLRKYSVIEATTNEEHAIKVQNKTVRLLRKKGYSVCTKNKNLDKYDWYVRIVKVHISIDSEYDK